MYYTKPILLLLLFLTVFPQTAQALGNPNAPRGGTFYLNLGGEPPTLNPITSQDAYASRLQSYIMDSLMSRNVDTYEWEAGLAESITTDKSGRVFTVKIRKGAKFSDGKPITAEDIKFSYEVYFDDAYNAASMRVYFEGIKKAEIIDPYTVRFTAGEKPYFRNYDTVAGLTIIPKHIYGDAKKGKKKNKTIVGSGPYMIDRYDKGKRIILKRNPLWWGYQSARKKEIYKFEKLFFRFIKEEQVELETLKKGKLDVMFLSPEAYSKKASGPLWKTKLLKKKVENKAPKGYGFIGWNLKNDLFKDKRVRKALAHLANRELMNQKFRFNMSKLATGPWYRDSIYASSKIKPISYSPQKASELLRKAGWKDSDKNGKLDKVINGKKTEFHFRLTYAGKNMEKYWTFYQGDLKKAGIRMDLGPIEWNSFIKLLDEKKFQAVALGWGAGSVDVDPKQIWHSSSAQKGGSNFISYKNPKVDALIDRARTKLNRKERIKLLKKVYELIADDAPYLFLFNSRYTLYSTQKRIQQEKDTYQFAVGLNYWWLQDQ